MITIMATAKITKIGGGRKPHLYIAEHMATKGMNKSQIANKLDINRSTVGKWLDKGDHIEIDQLRQLAHALDLEDWREFLRPPGQESVDAIIDEAPVNVREAIIEFAKRFKTARR